MEQEPGSDLESLNDIFISLDQTMCLLRRVFRSILQQILKVLRVLSTTEKANGSSWYPNHNGNTSAVPTTRSCTAAASSPPPPLLPHLRKIFPFFDFFRDSIRLCTSSPATALGGAPKAAPWREQG